MTTTLCRQALIALAVIMTLAGCTKTPSGEAEPLNDESTTVGPINILMFGDSGYHLNYPDQDDHEDLFTAEEF